MKSDGLQVLVIISLFIDINKPVLMGNTCELLLNNPDRNCWEHTGSGKKKSHCCFTASKPITLTSKCHTYNLLTEQADLESRSYCLK